MSLLPASVDAVAALDPNLAARLRDDLGRLTLAAEAMAWAQAQLPELLDAAQGGSSSGLLGALVAAARELMGVPTVWALCWSGDLADDTAAFQALAGEPPAGGAGPVDALAPGAISRAVVREVVRAGRPTWSDDARSDARFAASESIHLYALRSIGCVPVGARGVLYVLHESEPGAFPASARARLTALCRLGGLVADGLSAAPVSRPKRRPRGAPIDGLVGEAPAMQELLAAVRAFAPMPWPALVLGETGTGKEAVARALHALSASRRGPFVPVNCAAIPESLAESTLFGHVKGAFTGADRPSEGLVARARRGTLFLDEVGELPAAIQPKLLRLLQEGTFERVGSDRSERFEGRIVAATHRPLDRAEGRHSFREDLYHRLGSCVLRVPPLRERREDVPPIAAFLFARALRELGRDGEIRLDAAVLPALQAAPWPGNVRELENLLRGALARTIGDGGDVVGAGELGLPTLGEPVALRVRPAAPESAPTTAPLLPDLRAATDQFQRGQVRAALAQAGGNRSGAAQLLGVSRQWLHRLLSRWEGEP